MPITINSNIASLNAQRNLGKATLALTDSYAKLSSGLRINKASDDAAGLSIADYLRADKRIASVAVRNANDGISALNIADGAMNEISGLLARMGELAEQAGNGVLGVTQRVALSKEFEALGAEIDRIAAVTEFNGMNLLSNGSIILQIGLKGNTDGGASQISLQLQDVSAFGLSLGTYIPAFTIGASTNPIGGSNTGTAAESLKDENSARNALDAVKTAVSKIANIRGDLGAVQSRLATTVTNLNVTRENFSAAESQIRDVDVATEAAEMTRLTILQQAGASILAQANQQPALAVRLLS